jgi:hypothetical protein
MLPRIGGFRLQPEELVCVIPSQPPTAHGPLLTAHGPPPTPPTAHGPRPTAQVLVVKLVTSPTTGTETTSNPGAADDCWLAIGYST